MGGSRKALAARYHLHANHEVISAFAYYEARAPGQGEKLDEALRKLRKRIGSSPLAAPMWRGDPTIRIATLARFPFRLPYVIVPNDRIVILALAHTSRRPGYWVDRVRLL
jgi:toxin ParE1/3/4